jgi:hypothetical protein
MWHRGWYMSRKLELAREEKLFRLLPGRKESSRLEASGIALVDDTTALVVFDNLNQVARINLSLKRRASNRLLPAPSLGSGFEDIAIDHRHGRAFCLIEAMEDFDGFLRGFVAEYDRAGRFLRCTRLHTRFEEANKGFDSPTCGAEAASICTPCARVTSARAASRRAVVSTCSFARATGAGRRRTESAC